MSMSIQMLMVAAGMMRCSEELLLPVADDDAAVDVCPSASTTPWGIFFCSRVTLHTSSSCSRR